MVNRHGRQAARQSPIFHKTDISKVFGGKSMPLLVFETDSHRRCFTDACKDAVAVLTGNEPRFQATLWDDACYQGRLD